MKIRWIVLALVWFVAITIATRLPLFTGNSTEGMLQTSVIDLSYMNLVLRKMVHVITFGSLAMFILFASKEVKFKYTLAWGLATLVGALDELHQSFIPGRLGTIYDVLLNSFGASLFLLVIYLVKKKKGITKSTAQ